MEQLHILRCAFSANAKISFVSKLVCVAYSVLWEKNQLHPVKTVVFLPITLISPLFFLTVNTLFISLLPNFYFYPQYQNFFSPFILYIPAATSTKLAVARKTKERNIKIFKNIVFNESSHDKMKCDATNILNNKKN
jgi:hypothetical protein